MREFYVTNGNERSSNCREKQSLRDDDDVRQTCSFIMVVSIAIHRRDRDSEGTSSELSSVRGELFRSMFCKEIELVCKSLIVKVEFTFSIFKPS